VIAGLQGTQEKQMAVLNVQAEGSWNSKQSEAAAITERQSTAGSNEGIAGPTTARHFLPVLVTLNLKCCIAGTI
jgi:hypothetical protein